jgi:hypothetical protein
LVQERVQGLRKVQGSRRVQGLRKSLR